MATTITKNAEFVKDEFMQEFQDHSDFRAAIREVDAESQWSLVPLNKVVFRPASCYKADDLYLGNELALNDSKNLYPIVAELDGRPVLLRAYLAKQVKNHHRDEAAVLGDMARANAWDAYCNHLNLSAPYLKKNIQVMLRGAKASGWFGQFNSNWNETMQLDRLEEELQKDFPKHCFETGLYSHPFTEVRYSLSASIEDAEVETDAVLKAYASAWKQANMEGDIRMAKPMVKFTTGESGLNAITLSPYIVIGNSKLSLGPSLSVKHRGADETVWGAFDTFTTQIAAKFKDGLQALDKLCQLTVRHPYACMTHCLKQLVGLIPVAVLDETAEDYKIFFDPDDEEAQCLAVDIYAAISELAAKAAEKQSAIRQFQTSEVVGRILFSNWSALDTNPPSRLKACRDDKDN